MQTILQGVSIARTIEIMRELVHAHKQDVLPYKNLNIKSFFDLVKNLPYDPHEHKIGEVIKRPAVTLSQGGDCEDKAILIAAFLAAYPHKLQFNFRQFFITADYGKGEAHVFNGLRCHKGKWFYIDATYPKNEMWQVYSFPKKLNAYQI